MAPQEAFHSLDLRKLLYVRNRAMADQAAAPSAVRKFSGQLHPHNQSRNTSTPPSPVVVFANAPSHGGSGRCAERSPLLIQSQDEMIKAGRLSEPYKGIGDCFARTMKDEGVGSLWRGNTANVINQIFSYSGIKLCIQGLFQETVSTSRRTQMATGNGLVDSFIASFALGWVITNGAGLASYPIDTVRRRMMMTSGEAVKYKSSMDAFNQILKNEGAKSLFKGAGANILRAVAGAGVLAGYDKLQMIVFGKKYGSGGA
ncbi:uncharacterized protein A4U43_C01F33080 [Asparagus officinalis]|uniref:ADP/ATP translocase n=1 Tax=Asparagus officinalis TaxID=4686 RepID=A0A5P1FUA0_ASPOF|nr:uncharacterized protein A4U43_C01F33080 [Asparagus officinalis]